MLDKFKDCKYKSGYQSGFQTAEIYAEKRENQLRAIIADLKAENDVLLKLLSQYSSKYRGE